MSSLTCCEALLTCTVKLALDLLPCESVAVHVTGVVAAQFQLIGKTLPEAGEQETGTDAPFESRAAGW
jgi:hypothetical protein